jgi:hypothetical protein
MGRFARDTQPSSNLKWISKIKETHVKHWLSSSLTLFALVFALSFPMAVPAAPRTPQPKAAPAAAADRESHPEIRAAMANLREAREHLERAKHDFGGHRVAAIKAVDEAIHQLQLALESDKH